MQWMTEVSLPEGGLLPPTGAFGIAGAVGLPDGTDRGAIDDRTTKGDGPRLLARLTPRLRS